MNLRDKVAEYIEEQRKKTDLNKPHFLHIIQVGDNPASNLYVNSKLKEAEKWNIQCILDKFPENADPRDVRGKIATYSVFENTPMIIQLPLPKGWDEQSVINLISPRKNVDGFKQDRHEEFEYFIPCTPKGIIGFIKWYSTFENKNVVILGRGKTVGEPLVKLLLKENCTLTECNSHTSEITLKTLLKQADIVISAVGKPNMFCVDDLKENCLVIDAGISRIDGKQVGDFSHEGDLSKVDYTPWTNGVGKLTVASLMMNVRGV